VANLLSSAGTCAFTGNPASFGASLSSVAASFVVTGFGANYTRDFEAWFLRPFDADNWSGRAIQSEAWMPITAPSGTWTTEPQQAETWMPAIIQPDLWTSE
jgi:hypothetical protein